MMLKRSRSPSGCAAFEQPGRNARFAWLPEGPSKVRFGPSLSKKLLILGGSKLQTIPADSLRGGIKTKEFAAPMPLAENPFCLARYAVRLKYSSYVHDARLASNARASISRLGLNKLYCSRARLTLCSSSLPNFFHHGDITRF